MTGRGSPRANRAQRRSLGNRAFKRMYQKDVLGIIELSREGYSGKAIAAATGLNVEFVGLTLLNVSEAERGEGTSVG